jgi:Rrf2 family transcriptional regulator, cysteine metabolism repressor
MEGRPAMLKVSQKTEYAMRAMVELAIRRTSSGDALVPARALAEAQRIPLRFLEQQLGALHKAGLVESFRGAGGGCRLARDPATIRVAEVVDAIEGPLYPMYCLNEEDHTCFADGRCGLQELWGDVHLAIRGVFERTTLAELAERHRKVAERPVWAPSELIRPRG